ncbi:hypothetical protein [Variovorax sp. DT-64]|uniref:hypothetical protein n=1 Tax=Variovorax sp. DT-64 TaxID=3396160 RepID=UPI003F1A93D5
MSIEAGEQNHVFEVREKNLDIVKATLAKDENGYPALNLDHALNSLHDKGLKPTLLLIDEVGDDRNGFDKQITKNQLALIDKVKKLGGQVLICTRPCQPLLKPELESAVANVLHTFHSINPLNKLEDPELRKQVRAADFVIVAGFDTNACVRNTVGVQEDFNEYYENMTPGLVQDGIPVLFSDDCARGIKSNKWEGSRFEDALFFWGREDSSYRLADQAVQKYRENSGHKLGELETEFNSRTLRNLQSVISEINGQSTDQIIDLIRDFKISPDNPLLDLLTRPGEKKGLGLEPQLLAVATPREESLLGIYQRHELQHAAGSNNPRFIASRITMKLNALGKARALASSTRRWSGATRNWSPIGPVTLNPERASLIKMHSATNDIQPMAA